MVAISIDRTLPKPQGYSSDSTDAIGFVHFWGNSPALDLLGDPQAKFFGPAAVGVSPGSCYKDGSEDQDPLEEDAGDGDAGSRQQPVVPAPVPEDGPINILIAGAADIRHVLKTVARRRGGGKGPKLRFYLHETSHEALARHILFLQLVNNGSLPVRERMEIFLSVYGNVLVREKDSLYVSDIASELIELVTDNSEHPLCDVVDFSGLKFKDRDVLQSIFRGWKTDVPFDIEALREQRCRGYYRDRFDFRKNMMDWDYQSHIKDKAGIIGWFHYKAFCFTGIAFETRLGTYNTPNRTLASYTEAKDRSKGTTVQVRGFWGDIINSPYWAFGISTNDVDRPRLFKVNGSQYRHTEGDISEFNVADYIGQVDTGVETHLPAEKPAEHVFPYASPLEELRDDSCKVEEVHEEGQADAGADAKKTQQRGRSGRRTQKQREDWPPLSSGFADGGVEVVPLSGDLRELLSKSRFRGHFHRAFVGSMDIMGLFKDAKLEGEEDAFRVPQDEVKRIRSAPSVDRPELLGTLRQDSVFAAVMAEDAEVVVETLKYQAHFDAPQRLAFRHRAAQAGHLLGWRLADERRGVPRMEHDMKEKRAQDTEKYASDFLRFVTGPAPPEAVAAE